MLNKIDIHNCTTSEAKVMLDNYIDNLSPLVSEITVIHGYSSKVLQQYVRKQYHHKRAGRKILTMNAGETIILLK